MATKIGYIHISVSGYQPILSNLQYTIYINSDGIISQSPLKGAVEKLSNTKVIFKYDDNKIEIKDMLITYEIRPDIDSNLILARGTLKASEKQDSDILEGNNLIHIKSTVSITQEHKNSERQIRIQNCNHVDGAIHVAQYIVEEIRTNVNSSIADQIRYHLTGEVSNNLRKKFEDIEAQIKKTSEETGYTIYGSKHRQRSKARAYELWFNQVNTDKPWDHKLKIREKFKNVAVHRPLPPPRSTWSETWYHKYKEYDYFLDIWSNIHYGYVGRSVGFTSNQLLTGSDTAQFFSNLLSLTMDGDTVDDKTAIQIGIELFETYPLSRDITATKILNQIISKPDSRFPKSKVKHHCFR